MLPGQWVAKAMFISKGPPESSKPAALPDVRISKRPLQKKSQYLGDTNVEMISTRALGNSHCLGDHVRFECYLVLPGQWVTTQCSAGPLNFQAPAWKFTLPRRHRCENFQAGAWSHVSQHHLYLATSPDETFPQRAWHRRARRDDGDERAAAHGRTSGLDLLLDAT